MSNVITVSPAPAYSSKARQYNSMKNSDLGHELLKYVNHENEQCETEVADFEKLCRIIAGRMINLDYMKSRRAAGKPSPRKFGRQSYGRRPEFGSPSPDEETSYDPDDDEAAKVDRFDQ